jgi:hypothetical protein
MVLVSQAIYLQRRPIIVVFTVQVGDGSDDSPVKKRTSVSCVAQYYTDYVEIMGLEQNFRSSFTNVFKGTTPLKYCVKLAYWNGTLNASKFDT